MEWRTESATLQTKGQADAAASIIGGITSAAQAFGSIIAGFAALGPVGLAIGLGVATGVSGLIIAQSINAASMARQQTVLPPLSLAFAKGGVLGGTTATDSIGPAFLQSNESVIDAPRTDKLFDWIDSLEDRAANRQTPEVHQTVFESGSITFNIAKNDNPRQMQELSQDFESLIRGQRGQAMMR